MVKYYVLSTGRYLQSREEINGERLLHRQVWVQHHGPIPKGHHIHHKDGDWQNNDISNLECVEKSEHHRQHMAERWMDAAYREKTVKELEQAQEAAKAWHSTEEGLQFHSEIGRLSWKNRHPVKLKCEVCGTDYEAKRTEVAKYCSRACRMSVFYRASFTDTRKCEHCGKEFAASRHRTTRFCSRTCSARSRSK
jgi:hypothetical protein